MKQRLLSLLAVAALSLSAMAQWTAPVAPTIEGSDPVNGGVYYIMNLGCGQFIVGANSWATQISLSTSGEPYFNVVAEEASVEEENPETGELETVNGFKLKMNGTFYFSGDHNRTDYEVSNKYLFRDSETSGFVDLGSQARNAIWVLTKNENGNYYIQSTTEAGTFPNARTQYAGGTKAGQPVKFDCSIEDAGIEWRFVTEENYGSDYSAALQIYTARMALYEQYLKAVENSVDPSAYESVYTNESSTPEQLNAAATSLKADITKAVVLAKIAESSEENPIDITSIAIENPDFENGMEPWTITPGMGQNLQVQSQGYPFNPDDRSQPADGYDEFIMQNFIESWIASPNTLKDGVICQQVSGLPEGRYRIECDAIAVQQSGNLSISEQTGIFLYYNNGSYVLHSSEPVSTENGIPDHFEFDFDYAGDAVMTIGLMAENTNCNWMCMDNFRLYAIGQCKDEPLWTALMVVYNNLENYVYEVKAEANAVSALESALATAKSLIDAPSDASKKDEYQSAYDEIEVARKAVAESEAAYKKLKTFVDQLNSDQEKYTGELLTFVEELYSKYNSAYEEGSITTEDIEAAIAAYADQIKEKTQEIFDAAVAQNTTLENPVDITALFDGLSFPYSSTATKYGNGFPAENPVWIPRDTEGNVKTEGNFKLQYGTAEVWDSKPFDISYDITNLPKGSYTIKAHAFFRVEGNDTNYPNWQADPEYGKGYAYIYAGLNKTPITNVAAIADPLLVNINAPYDCGDGNYLPNNQQAAYQLFTVGDYASLAEKCYISATGNVLEDNGTLRIGFGGTNDLQGNQWTVVYNFELYYNGVASLDSDIESLIAALVETDDLGISGNVTLKTAALTKGKAALGGDFDTQVAAIESLQNAISELNRTQVIYNEMSALKATLENIVVDVTPVDQSFYTLCSEIDQSSESIESNAQIEGWIKALPETFRKGILSAEEISSASLTNPVDLSTAFINYSFDNNNKDFWTVEQEGNQGGDGDGCAEFWASTSFDLYQTFESLPTGYYRLSVDALYRHGGTVNDLDARVDGTITQPEYLYAGTSSVPVMSWSDTEGGAYTENMGLSGLAEYKSTDESIVVWTCNNKAVFETMVSDNRYHNELLFGYGVENGLSGQVRMGLKKDHKDIDSDWCPFDNFKLEFLGTVAPDAIEGISSKTAGTDAIYGIDGRQQSQLRRGINIVRTTDGNVKKVLVK
ncbi:MAG: hypothetical protein K6A32_00490 [Bacteroidales bacterium]|nr:hypothetical protein [Bacteroidales bacterium]